MPLVKRKFGVEFHERYVNQWPQLNNGPADVAGTAALPDASHCRVSLRFRCYPKRYVTGKDAEFL